MKNQYVGDVGDFGKYGLLRFLIEGTNLKLGVNWYLTQDDGTNDGKYLQYLRDNHNSCDAELLKCDSKLAEILKKITHDGQKNGTIREIERSGIFPSSTIYYNALLGEKVSHEKRDEWFKKSLEELKCDIVFADPDNGLSDTETSGKHMLYSEIKEYYKSGKSVIAYYHFDRTSEEERGHKLQEKSKLLGIENYYGLRFHRYSARDYWIFAQPRHRDIIVERISAFVKSKWCNDGYGHFSRVQ